MTATGLQFLLNEYTGLVNEGLQDVKALEDIGNTLMRSGFAPTSGIIRAAYAKRENLRIRLEEAKAVLSRDEAKAAIDPASVSQDTLDTNKQYVATLESAFKESQILLGEFVEAKKNFPQFSTQDISEIEWPENAASIIRGLSPQDKEIIGDELVTMFARGENDSLGKAVTVPESVDELLQLTDEIADYDPNRVLRDALDVAQRNYAEANRGYETGKSPQVAEARARVQFVREQIEDTSKAAVGSGSSDVMPGARNSRIHDPQFSHYSRQEF